MVICSFSLVARAIFLEGVKLRPYNTAACILSAPERAMKFEKTGRAIDREINRIVDILETRVRPQAERGATELLRRTADLLEELAERLEKKRAGKPVRRQKSAR